MTATEKVFIGDNGNMHMLSMDNEADYGKRFFEMTFKDAIDQGIICDYKILTIVVSDQRVAKAIRQNRLVTLNARNLREAEARQVATGIALKRVEKKFGVTHTFSFHPSILAAKRFRNQQDDLNRLGPRTVNLHVSSKMSAGERTNAMSEFESAGRALMTNARCLIEGVDAPVTDCVVFAEPKRSKIDIVQAAGRAMRIAKGKDYGYILLPIIVPRGMNFEEFAESTPFRRIARIIGTLATQDDRITDQFMAIEQGRNPSGKVVEISGDVPLGTRMNWRPFEEARKFARQLKLKSVMEWNDYCKSDSKPADIPTSPAGVYDAWVDWKTRIFMADRQSSGESRLKASFSQGPGPRSVPCAIGLSEQIFGAEQQVHGVGQSDQEVDERRIRLVPSRGRQQPCCSILTMPVNRSPPFRICRIIGIIYAGSPETFIHLRSRQRSKRSTPSWWAAS
jgi:Helicase conserved C-terminal domain